MSVTRQQAIKILSDVTDQDNWWEMACERAQCQEPYPSIFEVFEALGVSEIEFCKVTETPLSSRETSVPSNDSVQEGERTMIDALTQIRKFRRDAENADRDHLPGISMLRSWLRKLHINIVIGHDAAQDMTQDEIVNRLGEYPREHEHFTKIKPLNDPTIILCCLTKDIPSRDRPGHVHRAGAEIAPIRQSGPSRWIVEIRTPDDQGFWYERVEIGTEDSEVVEVPVKESTTSG